MKPRKLAHRGALAFVAISRISARARRRGLQPAAIPAIRAIAFLTTLVLTALFSLTSPPAHAAQALNLPSLQELIAPPPAPAASSPDAASGASAPGPSDADMLRSLDTVISTLDSDRQRSALVSQLKKLRDAKRAAEAAAPAPSTAAAAQPASTEAAAPPPTATATAASSVVAAIAQNAGLLGAIASALTSIEADVKRGKTPLAYWGGRFNAAGNELFTIVTSQSREPFGHTLFNYFATLAGWGACAFVLVSLQRRMHRRYGIEAGLHSNPTTRELFVFTMRRVAPYVFAFVAALTFVHMMPQSLGRTLAMVTAYAIVAGAVFSAICLIMFSLFGSAHRRVAVNVLILHARRLLFAIGTFGALGDAAANYDVAQQLGTNLSALISTCANMGAAGLTAYFALAFQRPVAHLIRSRTYEQRNTRKAATETFEVVASLWQLPLLLLASASVVATLAGIGTSENVLQMAIATAGLLVVAFFLSAIVIRITRPKSRKPRRQSAYVRRLVKFVGTMIVVAIWLGFLELSSRFWGFSLADMVERSVTARGIAHAVSMIVLTFFVVWLVWILIDTGIQEALKPDSARRSGRGPSMRARTMLPLVRNVVFVMLLLIAGIVTAANLGLNVTPLLAGAGVIGLAVGFGAQSLVADLITGLFIIIEDTISVGDSIEVEGGHAGIVESLTIRTVRLRDGQGAIHAIPFSQIKTVKNLSRDFAYAVFEVRVPFSADVDEVTEMIREVGAELMDDVRHRREMLGPVEVWGLDRFDPNWMVVKGQIKTRPLLQWSVARAFNLRIKRKMDEAGMEIPVPQMHVQMSKGGVSSPDDAAHAAKTKRIWVDEAPPLADDEPEPAAMAKAVDVSHEPRPAPPATDLSVPIPPQITTAPEPGKS
ncbi:mechanosensitive ion channel family protein [Caballeronia sp. LZ062]|uniref:mechanosensitive ion channel family protein n=1 Tax=unclassified Caballeronia TaxID=2646786 RepID=UPI0028583D6F|nr:MULTISPECIES: mechanosensitive ion channel family protein [unclassified Caballeronia]MDR5854115.1 mechanosensitive ion channel family protein [Caballeronia sp. LZ050]MDR5871354.1 mechanosensitive ion channel family protein [Caballeronia sp. LZ062]